MPVLLIVLQSACPLVPLRHICSKLTNADNRMQPMMLLSYMQAIFLLTLGCMCSDNKQPLIIIRPCSECR